MEILERQSDLQILEAALNDARTGTGRFVLVSGEAGIGKTTLVEHFADQHETDCDVLRGYCDPLLTPSPLGPLSDIARTNQSLRHLLNSETKQLALFSRLLEALSEANRTPVLLIEDIHWADEATIDLMKYLSRRLTGLGVLLVATYRDDEVQNSDPLRFLLGDIATTRSVQRIEIKGLSREAVAQLAGDRIADVDGLYRLTDGNPFFVTEVLENDGVSTPATIRDAVLGRALLLSEPGRRVLDLASVIGARIEYELLEQFPEICEAGLPECLAFGLLQERRSGVAFRHELSRRAVLEAIDPLRRRALSREVLKAAVQVGFAEKGRMARLAHFAESAHSAEDVLTFGAKAGRAASLLGSHREAASHYRGVLRFADECNAAERAGYLANFAYESAIIDCLPDAIKAYRQSAELWRENGEPERQAETLTALAWPLVRHGANAEADETIEQAIALLEPLGASSRLANAYRTKAHLRMLDRDTSNAVTIGRHAIDMASTFGDRTILAEAEMTVGAALLVTDVPEGKDHLDRCIEIASDEGADAIVALARMNLGTAYGEQYRFAEAEAHLHQGMAFCRDKDLDHSGNYMLSWLALTLVFQGRWDEASSLCSDLLNKPDLAAISRIMGLIALGRLRVRRGDTGAADALDEALDLANRTSTLQRLAPVHAARAEMAWFAGDHDAVEMEVDAVFDLAVRRRHAWHTGEFSYWLTSIGKPVAAMDWLARPFALQIAGDWQVAAKLWHERNCPFEEGRALAAGDEAARLEALSLFDKLGAVPAAAALRRDLRATGAERVPRGPRASTLNNPFGLTNREMTILGYLVERHSNAGIAEALFVSPKTVDHHVSAILQKLGVSSRGAAAQVALDAELFHQNGEGEMQK